MFSFINYSKFRVFTYIIDIGSNSLRLVIYNICKNSKFRIIYETKQTIRLGSYLTDENYLLEEGVNIAISVLDNFKKICENYSVIDIYTVATEAIRKSINKEEVCTRIEKDLGFKGYSELVFDREQELKSMILTK